VLSKNSAPGDSFTNPGDTKQGQAVGADGWIYYNVVKGGSVGISTTYPRDGTGSAYMATPSWPAGDWNNYAQAYIAYLMAPQPLNDNFIAMGSLGKLSDLTSFSVECYRDVATNVTSYFHPPLRILVDRDGDLNTTTDRGTLVYEEVYMSGSKPMPEGEWTKYMVGSTTKLWNTGLDLDWCYYLDQSCLNPPKIKCDSHSSSNYCDIDGDNDYFDTLADWKASPLMANAVIVGFSIGIGGGWDGSYIGAVDNIAWTIDGVTTATNFEVRFSQERGGLSAVFCMHCARCRCLHVCRQWTVSAGNWLDPAQVSHPCSPS
jgi:hypothetical protein